MEFNRDECRPATGERSAGWAFWQNQEKLRSRKARSSRSSSEPPRLNTAATASAPAPATERERPGSHRGVTPVQVLLVAPAEEEEENTQRQEEQEPEEEPSPLRDSTTESMAGYNEEWVDVQKNTFTRWANTYLSRKRMTIDDLYEDLKDGIRLISLLQIICREKVCRKFNKKPRMRIQKMENLNFAFAFMQKKNVNVTNIGSSDILDGNNKLVLGLMWTLIKSFQVAEIDVEGVSGKDGLLLWVNRSLADYPTVDVKNFSSSWADGMAFCALIHRYAPTLIDFNSLNPKDAQSNVKLAFDIAREKFRIPQLLEVENVAGQAKPDEKSITTYVSLLFKEFASGVQKKKAVTTISKALNIAQRHQELAAEFNKNASGLLEWLQQQTERFQTLSQPRHIPDIKEALARHLEYKKNEKPPREAQFVAVEGCAGRWIASCKNNGRAVPNLDPPIEKLQALKAHLDELETAFELKLRQNLDSYQKTEIFLTKVVKDLEKVESWAKEKEALSLFAEDLHITSTTDAEEKLESVAFLQDIELPRYKQLLAMVVTEADGLSEEHKETKATLQRVEAMKNFVAMAESKVEGVKTRLEESLRIQQNMDAVAKDAKTLMRNLKYVIEEMDEEVEAATKLQDVSTAGVVAAKHQFDTVLVPKVQNAVVSENEKLIEKKHILADAGRESDVALIEKTNARVQRLLDSLAEKRGYYEEELANVEKRDEVCREFANLSARIKERCAQSTQSINVVEGSLKDQFNSMVKLRHRLFRANTGVVLEEEVEEKPEDPEITGVETPAAEEVKPAAETVAPESEEGDKSKDVTTEVEETKAKQVEEAKAKAVEIITPLTEDMEKLERINEELERLQVHTNPFTTDTIHGLRAQFTSLEIAVRDKVKSLEKELVLSEVGSLTPQQAKEIKEVFDHFDLDNDGVLARDEFIMACKGLGLSLSEDDCHDYFDKIDEEENDEITFDEFAVFCTEQLQSGSTKDDVHEALDILIGDELTLEQIEERFDASQIEFIKKHAPELLEADGKSIDTEKFTDFIFSV
ncbi:Alpha-actinin A [Phytophthora citrophthora]|uniref:Alpha-actinin A n=1 Tax=Phytophthora citrophthora TaxID=4793 RepID=A0AAD9G0P5_9STRA|nr:Alpha-actinin A [Phytophthora citrophthora]